MTALYDAIGKTINADKARLKKLGDEAPSKVLVCVVTDGMENDSKEYSLQNIKDLIRDCEKDDWNFVYLAANQDAFSVGQSFGISGGNTYTYTPTVDGVTNMSNKLSSVTASYRSMSASSASFSADSKNLMAEDDDDENGTITTSNSTGTVTLDNE